MRAFQMFCLMVWLLLPPAIGVEPVAATAWQARGGLANVERKLSAGEAVSVVFIGGSITKGANRNGYVRTIGDWLRERYPQATVIVHNAGVSGTDSHFGAKRFDRDVLAHKPDLVFIEFAVNDGDRDHTMHMERMVHKTWMADPETDLLIFYTLSRGHLPDYEAGLLPRAASFHERVAAHYSIPTLGLAHYVAGKLQSGEIEWADFASDSVHPHAGGYALFDEALVQALPELLAAGEPGPHRLGESLTRNLVIYPEPMPVQELVVPPFVNGEGREAVAQFALPIPGIHWAGDPVYAAEDGKPLWRLHWIDKAKTAAMDTQVGLRKADWSENLMRWFAEDNSFTGVEGLGLFTARPQGEVRLGFSGRESAVLVFVAPQTGRYTVRVQAEGLDVWQSQDRRFALNVAKFQWGEGAGTPVALYAQVRRDIEPFMLEAALQMSAGEELIFVPASDSPAHIRGGWSPIRIHIGYWGEM